MEKTIQALQKIFFVIFLLSNLNNTVIAQELSPITVTFRSNGQTVSTATKFPINLSTIQAPLPDQPILDAGWAFAGWSEQETNGDATEHTILSGTYTPTSDITLHAIFQNNKNGGIYNSAPYGKADITITPNTLQKFTPQLTEQKITVKAVYLSGNAKITFTGKDATAFEAKPDYVNGEMEIFLYFTKAAEFNKTFDATLNISGEGLDKRHVSKSLHLTAQTPEEPSIKSSAYDLSFTKKGERQEIIITTKNIIGEISIAIKGDNADVFKVEPVKIATSEPSALQITYDPVKAGKHNAKLTLSGKGEGDIPLTCEITLKGTAINISNLETTRDSIQFGLVKEFKQYSETFILSGSKLTSEQVRIKSNNPSFVVSENAVNPVDGKIAGIEISVTYDVNQAKKFTHEDNATITISGGGTTPIVIDVHIDYPHIVSNIREFIDEGKKMWIKKDSKLIVIKNRISTTTQSADKRHTFIYDGTGTLLIFANDKNAPTLQPGDQLYNICGKYTEFRGAFQLKPDSITFSSKTSIVGNTAVPEPSTYTISKCYGPEDVTKSELHKQVKLSNLLYTHKEPSSPGSKNFVYVLKDEKGDSINGFDNIFHTRLDTLKSHDRIDITAIIGYHNSYQLHITQYTINPTVYGYTDTLTIKAGLGQNSLQPFNIISRYLQGDVQLQIKGKDANRFSIDQSIIKKIDSVETTTPIIIAFNAPTKAGIYSAYIEATTPGSPIIRIPIAGVVDDRYAPYKITFVNGTNPHGLLETMGAINLSEIDNPAPTPSELCASRGWVFEGWSEQQTEGDVTSHPLLPNIYTPRKDITLYAIYKQQTGEVSIYNSWPDCFPMSIITFDGMGAENTMPVQDIEQQKPTKINKSTLTKTGLVFAGWDVDETGTTVTYKDQDEIIVQGDITLYAVWKEPATITAVPETLDIFTSELKHQTLKITANNLISDATITLTGAAEAYTVTPNTISNGETELSIDFIKEITNTPYNAVLTIEGTGIGNDIITLAIDLKTEANYQVDFINGPSAHATQVTTGIIDYTQVTTPACSETCQAKGWEFAGWSLTKTEGDSDSHDIISEDFTVTSSCTLYAIYKLTIGTATIYNSWPTCYTISRVTFDGKGAENAMAAQEIEQNISTKLNKCTLTKTDYAFAGWDIDQAGTTIVFKDQAEITITSDTTLYAVWKAPATMIVTPEKLDIFTTELIEQTLSVKALSLIDSAQVTITGDQAEAFEVTPSKIGEGDTELTIRFTKPHSPGREFNATLTIEGDAAGGITLTKSLDLIAKTPKVPLTVTFINGETIQQVEETKESIDLSTIATPYPSEICQTRGWEFAGWSLTKTEGDVESHSVLENIYTPIDSVELYATYKHTEGGITIYNSWPSCYPMSTVTFNGMGSDNSMDDQSIEQNVLSKLNKCTLTKAGFVFAGWDTDKAGTTIAYKDEAEITITGDITLYAVWKEPASLTITPEALEIFSPDLQEQTLTVTATSLLDSLTATISGTDAGSFMISPSTIGEGINTVIVRFTDATIKGREFNATLTIEGLGVGNAPLKATIDLAARTPNDTYTVTFMNQGEIHHTAETEGEIDLSQISTPSPSAESVQSGWIFAGWSTKPTQGDVEHHNIIAGNSYIVTEDIFLYAIYSNSTITAGKTIYNSWPNQSKDGYLYELAYTVTFNDNEILPETIIDEKNFNQTAKVIDGKFKDTKVEYAWTDHCSRSDHGVLLNKINRRAHAELEFDIKVTDTTPIAKMVVYTTNVEGTNSFSCGLNLQQPEQMENITSDHTFTITPNISVNNVYFDVTYGGLDIQKIEFYTGTQKEEINAIIVNPGEIVRINEDRQVNDVIIRSNNQDQTGQILLSANLISNNGLTIEKAIDDTRWYFFSLPFDCPIDNAVLESEDGTTWHYGSSKTGGNFIIRYHDQVAFANGAKHGWTDYDWKHKPLKAGQGYIIGLFPKGAKAKITFKSHSPYTMTSPQPHTYSFGSGYVWCSYNDKVEAKFRGWNLIGSPFHHNLRFGSLIFNSSSTSMVSIPNMDGKTYTQKTVTDVLACENIKPLSSFFVQVAQNKPAVIKTTINNPSSPKRVSGDRREERWIIKIEDEKENSDETSIVSIAGKTTDYEIGYDLMKLKGYAQIPQIYSYEGNDELAFNAQEINSSANLKLGIYAPKSQTYTISSDPEMIAADRTLTLYDNKTGIATDLSAGTYTVYLDKGEYRERFHVEVESRSVPTNSDLNIEEQAWAYTANGTINIENLPAGSIIYIYDAVGRLLHTEKAESLNMTYQVPAKGVYNIVIKSEDHIQTLKTIQ